VNDQERSNQDLVTGAALGIPSLIGIMREVEAKRRKTMTRLERASFATAFLEGVRMMERAAYTEAIRAHNEYRELDARCTECGAEEASLGLCDRCSLLAHDLAGQAVGDYIDALDAKEEAERPPIASLTMSEAEYHEFREVQAEEDAAARAAAVTEAILADPDAALRAAGEAQS
jgi:hypothetical protein